MGTSPRITTQLAVVVGIGIVGFVGLVLGLAVWADWSDGAIIGMASAFGALLTSTIVTVRNQQKTVETLDRQDSKLDEITKQTNGVSHDERQDIANRAARAALEQREATE